MKRFLIVLTLFLTSCEHIPSKEYNVETVDGEILTFVCPEVDVYRNRLTYTYDRDCVLSNR